MGISSLAILTLRSKIGELFTLRNFTAKKMAKNGRYPYITLQNWQNSYFTRPHRPTMSKMATILSSRGKKDKNQPLYYAASTPQIPPRAAQQFSPLHDLAKH